MPQVRFYKATPATNINYKPHGRIKPSVYIGKSTVQGKETVQETVERVLNEHVTQKRQRHGALFEQTLSRGQVTFEFLEELFLTDDQNNKNPTEDERAWMNSYEQSGYFILNELR